MATTFAVRPFLRACAMSANKFRLVTRADFDGAVSGCLLMELEMIGEVMFAEPKQVQDGEIEIDSNDILTNLPYAENAHLCIDHHLSEVERVGARDNLVIDPEAPSAARVVYEHFGGRQAFPGISDEMMAAVDRADAAQYEEADILAPEPWTMLNFMLDPRTGLDRFGPYQISNHQMMKEMMVYLRHTPVEEIMKLPDVEERQHVFMAHAELFEMQIKDCATLHGNLVVVDFRSQDPIYCGNRFTVYALYPECNISIQILPFGPDRTVFAVGKSILDRSSRTNVGELMLKYGGGGHRAVGTCRAANADADRVLGELVAQITSDG